MRMISEQERINYLKDIWQAICWRMNMRRTTPAELAYKTGYSKDHIERGIAGEPIPLTDDFIHRCVMAFGLTSGRTKYYEDTVDILSFDDCVKLIRPEPSMPPRQGNFWDDLDRS